MMPGRVQQKQYYYSPDSVPSKLILLVRTGELLAMEVVSLDKIVSRVQMTDKDYSQTCLPNTVQGQYPPRPTH